MKNQNIEAIFFSHETERNIESIHHDTHRTTHKPNIPKSSKKEKRLVCPNNPKYLCNKPTCIVVKMRDF